MLWVLVPLASFLWRIRGGLLNAITGKANWLGFNDTVVRLIYSLGLALAYGFFAGWTWHVGALAVAFFLGCTLIGWFGANLFPEKLSDILLLSLSGLLRMGFVSLALFSVWPLIIGALCGPIYWLGSKVPQVPGGWDFWQEWFFGAAIGISLILSILIHGFI